MYEISQVASEGRCLLSQNFFRGDHVYTDGQFYNIFSLMLSQPTPRGGDLGFGPAGPGGGFGVTSAADEARTMLADATLIMSPRNNLMPAVFVGLPAADSTMRNFVEIGRTHYWSLWQRKSTRSEDPYG